MLKQKLPCLLRPIPVVNNRTERKNCGQQTSPILFFWTTNRQQPISISPKIRELPSGILLQTPDFKKFRPDMSIALSTKLVVVVVDCRACWRHLYDSRRVVAVYYKSVNCNVQIPLSWPNGLCRRPGSQTWVSDKVHGLTCRAGFSTAPNRARVVEVWQ